MIKTKRTSTRALLRGAYLESKWLHTPFRVGSSLTPYRLVFELILDCRATLPLRPQRIEFGHCPDCPLPEMDGEALSPDGRANDRLRPRGIIPLSWLRHAVRRPSGGSLHEEVFFQAFHERKSDTPCK